MVETSGRKLEINDAFVSTLADKGETGQWLLDPGDIDITSSGTGTSLYYSFIPSENTSIRTSAVESALNSNNLTIQTGSGGHYINVSDPINFTNNSLINLKLFVYGFNVHLVFLFIGGCPNEYPLVFGLVVLVYEVSSA